MIHEVYQILQTLLNLNPGQCQVLPVCYKQSV